MTLDAWRAYKRSAWGSNELKPMSKQPNYDETMFGNAPNLGATIVDSLDTLYLMGLMSEFNEAAHWVRNKFNVNTNTDMSIFEINIRIVGGLLSAFTLTRQRVFFHTQGQEMNTILVKTVSH